MATAAMAEVDCCKEFANYGMNSILAGYSLDRHYIVGLINFAPSWKALTDSNDGLRGRIVGPQLAHWQHLSRFRLFSES